MSLLKVHYLLCELVAIEKGIKAKGGLFMRLFIMEIVQATLAGYSPGHAEKGVGTGRKYRARRKSICEVTAGRFSR